MIESLNHLSQYWYSWQLAMLWQVALLIAIIWSIDLMIRKWAWPQLRYALWMLVLVKLLIPPTWTSPLSVTSHLPSMASQTVHINLIDSPPPTADPAPEPVISKQAPLEAVSLAPLAEAPEEVAVQPVDSFEAALPEVTALPEDSSPPQAIQPTPVTPAVMPSLTLKSYAMLIWMMGVIGLSLWLIIRLAGLRKSHLNNDTHPSLPDWFDAQLKLAAKDLNLNRLPKVVLTHKVTCPAVFGILRPVLLIPADKMDRMTRDDARHILLHELAHIKRGDLVIHAVYMLTQIVYWFNPLLWMIRKTLQNLRELCCDATVAKLLKEDTVHYRQTLLETARQLLAEPVDPGLGLLGLFENSNWLITRLKWLEKKTWKNRKLRIATILALVAVMTTCVLPMANRIKKENDQTYIMTLPNGMTIEVLGLCQYPVYLSQWWAPDGSVLTDAVYDYSGDHIYADDDHRAYDLAIRYDHIPSGLGSVFYVEKSGSSIGGTLHSSVRKNGDYLDQYVSGKLVSKVSHLGFELDKKQEVCVLKVGVAEGPWQTNYESKYQGEDSWNSTTQSRSDGGVVFARPIAEGKRSWITITHTIDKKLFDVRYVAVTQDDKEITPIRNEGGGVGQTVQQTLLFDYPLDQLKAFQVQTRTYQWYEFKDIALRITDADHTVTGTVTDADTGDPIEDVEVYDDGYNDGKFRTKTDDEGKFTLFTANEEHTISAKADGYDSQTKTLTTFPFANNKEFDFQLKQNVVPTDVQSAVLLPEYFESKTVLSLKTGQLISQDQADASKEPYLFYAMTFLPGENPANYTVQNIPDKCIGIEAGNMDLGNNLWAPESQSKNYLWQLKSTKVFDEIQSRPRLTYNNQITGEEITTNTVFVSSLNNDWPYITPFKADDGTLGVFEISNVQDRKIYVKYKILSLSEKESTPEIHYQTRHFVRLVVGGDSMTFQGEPVTMEDLPGMLELISNKENTVLQVAFTEFPENRKERWWYDDPVLQKAGQLVDQLGFEYLSFVGKHPLGTPGSPARNGLFKPMQFDKDIALDLPSAEQPPLVKLNAITFSKDKAAIKAAVTSHPKTHWDIELAFYDKNNDRLDYVFKNYENSGVIAGVAAMTQNTIDIDLTRIKDLDKAKTFEISIKQRELKQPEPQEAITSQLKTEKSSFSAKLPNGTQVELLGLLRLTGERIESWSPNGEPMQFPDIVESDLDGKGIVMAYRVTGLNVSLSLFKVDSSQNKSIYTWCLDNSDIWLAKLPEQLRYIEVTLDIHSGHWKKFLYFPVTSDELQANQWITKYSDMGAEKIGDFKALSPDSFKVSFVGLQKKIPGDILAVDQSDRMHRDFAGGYSQRGIEQSYKLPPKDLAGFGQGEQDSGTVHFKNISLVPGQTSVITIDTTFSTVEEKYGLEPGLLSQKPEHKIQRSLPITDWKTIAESYTVDSRIATQGSTVSTDYGSSIIFGNAYEKSGQSFIGITDSIDREQYDVRILAVDREGNLHTQNGGGSSSTRSADSSQTVNTQTAAFDCPLENVSVFRFQIRSNPKAGASIENDQSADRTRYPVDARSASPLNEKVQNISFKKDMPMVDALRMLSQMYEVNMIPSEQVANPHSLTRVNNLYDVTFEETLQALCGTEYTYVQKDNLIYVYTNDEYEKLPKELTLEQAKKAVEIFFAEKRQQVAAFTPLGWGDLTPRADGTMSITCRYKATFVDSDEIEDRNVIFYFDKTGKVDKFMNLKNSPSSDTELDSKEAIEIYTQIAILQNGKRQEREKWFQAVKTLVDIGSPAVPALSEVILTTNSPWTQSTTALTLRAIGDPKAVPALIDALEKSGFSSDYGYGDLDTELARFIHKYQIDPLSNSVGLGRPVREITISLERLTGHTEGHDHFNAYDQNGKQLGNFTVTPEIRDRQKMHRKQVAQQWRSWWQGNQETQIRQGIIAAREGVELEFYILPEPKKEDWTGLTPEDIAKYRQELQTEGPWPGSVRGDSYQWIFLNDDFQDNTLVVDTYQGQQYAERFKGKRFVLHAARAAYAVYSDRTWGLKSVLVESDDRGRPAIRIEFDPAGAKKIRTLTENNLGRRLAIIVGGEVVMAPQINSPISKQIVIVGGITENESMQMAEELKKGMPPVTFEVKEIDDPSDAAEINIPNFDVRPVLLDIKKGTLCEMKDIKDDEAFLEECKKTNTSYAGFDPTGNKGSIGFVLCKITGYSSRNDDGITSVEFDYDNLPIQFDIETVDAIIYRVKVISGDRNSCTIRYFPHET